MEGSLQKKVPAIFVLLFVVVGIGMWWFFRKVDFVISNVPYITIYNHTGDNAHIVTSPGAVLASVLEYYGVTLSVADYQKMNVQFFNSENPATMYTQDDIMTYAKQLGYEASFETFSSLKDLKRYINPKTKVPLIFSHSLIIGQNHLVRQTPKGVLIGVLEKENAVVVHDYYWGYNKKVDWADFQKMAGLSYLIIRPKSSDVLGNKKISYPERTASMDKAAPIIDKITLGRVALLQQQRKAAFGYFREAVNDKDFLENVPPYYKVVAYSGLAYGELASRQDINTALKIALIAEDLNHDLDKPFGDYWPGFEDRTNTVTNEYSGSYFVLGQVYEAKKEFGLAKEAYQKALSIWGDNTYAQDALLKLNKSIENPPLP